MYTVLRRIEMRAASMDFADSIVYSIFLLDKIIDS